MIVIAIIAVLASIALPAYQDYIAKSQLTEALVLADGLKTPVIEYYLQTTNCPVNGNGSVATSTTGKYVLSVAAAGTAATTGGCTITATMKATGVSSGIVGKTVVYTLVAGDTFGSFNWTCVSTAKQKYISSACTGA